MKVALLVFVYLFLCVSARRFHSLHDLRIASIKELYDHLIYPGSLPIIESNGTAATFLDPNCSGRVTPVGMFIGRQDSNEYFYALGSPVTANITAGQLRVIGYDIRVLDLLGTRASVRVDVHFSVYPSNVTAFNLTQIGWIGFLPNSHKIRFYDLAILRLGDVFDGPPTAYPTLIQTLCAAQDKNCQGANKQYANISACVDFMTNNITFGTWNNVFSDTVVCRILHNILAEVRPEVHCPHVGPTGGMKCIPHPYEEWYQYEFIDNLRKDSQRNIREELA